MRILKPNKQEKINKKESYTWYIYLNVMNTNKLFIIINFLKLLVGYNISKYVIIYSYF